MILALIARYHIVLDTGSVVGPLDRLTGFAHFERVAKATLVTLVEFAPDSIADQRTNGNADNRGYRPVVPVTSLVADNTANDTADNSAHLFTVAVAGQNTLVAFPAITCISDVIRIVLLPPAVRRRMSRRIRQRLGEPSGNEYEQKAPGNPNHVDTLICLSNMFSIVAGKSTALRDLAHGAAQRCGYVKREVAMTWSGWIFEHTRATFLSAGTL